MLFNSFEFLIFFPIVTVLYFALPHRWRWLLLLVSSCLFYMALIPIYILILVFTISVDYVAGLLIENSKGLSRRLWLGLSIAANVGVLAFFKYFNFINDNLRFVADSFDLNYAGPTFYLALPVGLSFHTFQAMSYTIEVYRGREKAERSLGIFALYVMFYPQLVAGPIERPQNLLPQFRRMHFFVYDNATSGLRMMAWGLFKKTVIADRLAVLVNTVYASPYEFNGLQLAIGTVCFAFQIYCDFSGYSDIALGAARFMGFDLMVNFRQPYFSQSISEFWRRWHISLSTWFKDYVYVPLGGSRVSFARHCFNLMVVFILSGLWHGANWTFVVWGALHGSYLVASVLTERICARTARCKLYMSCPLRTLFRVLSVFVLVNIGWVFFRADTLRDALHILATLPSAFDSFDRYEFRRSIRELGFSLNQWALLAGALALLFVVELLQRKWRVGTYFARCPLWVRWPIYYAAIYTIIKYGRYGHEQFIYFQF